MEYLETKGIQIPRLGFGTWQLNGETAFAAVDHALNIGLCHIDTAQIYDNEEWVGKAIKQSAIPRENIFLTTKLWEHHLRGENSLIKGTEESLQKLQTDYVDLLLIHWPFSGIPLKECLQAMEKLKKSGKIRSVGVSNFTSEILKQALEFCPQIVTNQVEYHPLLNQDTLLETVKNHNVFLTAYSPLARGHVMKIQQLKTIGQKYKKNPAQVALRWLVEQKNVVCIFKSANSQRIESNFNIFDFELSPEDKKIIQQLTHNNKRIVSPSFAPKWDTKH